MSNHPHEAVTAQADRLRWLINLIQSDTQILFNSVDDKLSEFTLIDFCQALHAAETAIELRHDAFLSGR